MGWFDDSDSDDEAKINKKKPIHFFTPASSTTDQKLSCTDDKRSNDEEDDPLDMFMKSLSSTVIKSDSVGPSVTRLDVENEEESTAHWDMYSQTDIHSSIVHKKDINDDVNEAKMSMQNMFHKAGEGKNFSANLDESDSNDLGAETRSIEPLEKVDHEAISYKPFRKHFRDTPRTCLGSTWRQEHNISCSNQHIDPVLSFEEYKSTFKPEVLAYLKANQYLIPTPVQAQSIPISLTGKDLIVTSHTGSGKTLAYLLPLLIHVMDQDEIKPKVDGPIGVVLTPTRELAKQVYSIAKNLFKLLGGKVILITGGNLGTYEISKELKKGCELVLCTPGRLIDMVKKRATNLKRATMVVLDEADKMLELGFGPQVTSILENIRPDRQTLMFSATFGKKVEANARRWLNNPVRISVGITGTTSEHVDQHVFCFNTFDDKVTWLLEMIPVLAPIGRVIIFVSSRETCNALTKSVQNALHSDIQVDFIHGERHQMDRTKALGDFRDGKVQVLIATDVASRGLDVTDVMTVVNFDPATSFDSHVHRCGRAGRLSNKSKEQKKGVAYTLLTDKDADFAQTLMESFEREGRGEITNQLVQLAMKSKRYGGSVRKNTRFGLGYDMHEHGEPSKRTRWK